MRHIMPNEPINSHSLKMISLFNEVALPTHVENFDEPDGADRRQFLKSVMLASTAIAVGLQGCARKPDRKIISRVTRPEYMKPGMALYYSSTWTEGSTSYGTIIKTVDGRPIKIEGNPDHPINKGSSTSAMQASLLSLYDPDRLQSPTNGETSISWDESDQKIISALKSSSSTVLITRATLGPAERSLVRQFLKVAPNATRFTHEAVHDNARRSVWKEVYGSDGELIPQFDKAKIILSLDCDFLAKDGAVLENIRTFTRGRSVENQSHKTASMSRLYVAEGAMTLTGSNADHRIRLKPSALAKLINAIILAYKGEHNSLIEFANSHDIDEQILTTLVRDLHSHHGASLVVAGSHLPKTIHASVALLNELVNAHDHTLLWNATPGTQMVSDVDKVNIAVQGADVVLCLGVNPIYDWPGGEFASLLSNAKLTISHSCYSDETAAAFSLSLASHHGLESWNDAQPRTGLRTLCQPVITPLYSTRQEAESLFVWTKELSDKSDAINQIPDWHAYLKRQWQSFSDVIDGASWDEYLRIGGEFDIQFDRMPSVNNDAAQKLIAEFPESDAFELIVTPHHSISDGRFSNNAWLQELPDPMSKLVWDNACSISKTTADHLGVGEGDLIRIEVDGRSLRLPVLIQPGMADRVLVSNLGFGRVHGGSVAIEARGSNTSQLLNPQSITPRFATNVKVEKAAGAVKLVRTQIEFSMHNRPIVLDGTLAEYQHDDQFIKHKKHLPEEADLYQPFDYSKGHKWAIAIDLASCVGCSGCMTACQAENNIPVVGREECDVGREMHWIRIDRYEDGDADNPTVHHQPMLCQHCDNAPCENVCPVNATTHSPEGLNEMIYNRCVGTRYCANNCPYKVRRFNFLRYQKTQLRESVQELVFNPQVTVRGIGVMEKCTFCIQRINEVKFKASNNGDAIADQDIKTACEQSCPSNAIVFGDANDPDSRIAKLRNSDRAFHVLEELAVKPNVTYLAQLRNTVASDQSPGNHTAGGH